MYESHCFPEYEGQGQGSSDTVEMRIGKAPEMDTS